MAEVIVKIPNELEKTIRESKIDWSAIARRAILDKAEQLRRLKQIGARAKVSEKAGKEFTDKISMTVARRHKEA